MRMPYPQLCVTYSLKIDCRHLLFVLELSSPAEAANFPFPVLEVNDANATQETPSDVDANDANKTGFGGLTHVVILKDINDGAAESLQRD